MKQAKDNSSARALKLFLLVENRLLREALAGIVRKQPDFSIVGVDRSAPSGGEAGVASRRRVLAADHAPATTFPPTLLPDSLALAPEMKVVLFGMEEDAE